jgi:hypothetical protein
MAVATSTALIIAAVVVAAAAAGTGAYLSSEQAAAQARDQMKASKHKAEAERQAAAARRKHVLWEAGKRQKGMLSAQAAAGVEIGEGASLLENEMEFASAAEYDAQLSEFPHLLNSAQDDYTARLFGRQADRIKSMQGVNTGLAVGSSLASSYGAYGGMLGGGGTGAGSNAWV